MTDANTKPPLFRYEVHTDTICQGWINCWTVSEGDGLPYFDSFQSIAEAEREINELDDPENHRVYDNVTGTYV